MQKGYSAKVHNAEVLKVHKGNLVSSLIQIYSFLDPGGCDFHFKSGESYLFYGQKIEEGGYFHTGICNRTKLLKASQYDLNQIAQICE